ncbi:MAG TPA: translocation/assembly module TamB domain-containing protein [Rhizomicrobium sp.]|nr:translocation/assembly module TamB domain-containing protein [Rhizomicrobium sp.]
MVAWRHIGRWAAWACGALLLALGLLFYTPPGLSLVARLAGSLSGDMVQVEGLSGFFPNRLNARRIAIADVNGVWLEIDEASLQWSALAAIANHISVRDISATRIAVLRRPIPSTTTSKGENPQIDIDRLSLPRIEIAAPVIGRAAVLSMSGSLHFTSLHQMEADLAVTRATSSDSYRVQGGIAQDVAHGSVIIREGADGILGKLAGLPTLGPVNVTAQAGGDRAANNLSFALSAGPLHADGHGVIRLAARNADMDVTLAAPSMTPMPGIAWQSLSGGAHVHGSFDAPLMEAHLILADGAFQGVAVKRITLDLSGNNGAAQLEGALEGVTLPGNHPDLLAGGPVRLEAQANLKDALRPVTFAIQHPLTSLRGTAQTRGTIAVTADLRVPSLAPLAALGNLDMGGTASAHVTARRSGTQTEVALKSTFDTQGPAVPARLLGRKAVLDLDAALDGNDVARSRLHVTGAAITADVSGSLQKNILNYRLALDLSDLSRVAGTLLGTLRLRGNVNGPIHDAAVSASGTASLATKGFSRQAINIELQAEGLPSLRTARLDTAGRFDGAPLAVHAALAGGRTRPITLSARWKSLNATANITMPQGTAASGKANVAVARLADFAVFTGNQIAGSANAALTLKARGAKTDATLQAQLQDLKTGDTAVHTVGLNGTASDILGKPAANLALAVQGIVAQGFSGDAQARIDGPADRLALTFDTSLKDNGGQTAKAGAAALLNLSRQQITLNRLDASWRGVPLALARPATVDFAKGLAVDQLAMRLGNGTITAGGRLLPAMALKASVRNVTLETFKSFLPQVGAQGTFSADAVLNGPLAAPQGTISLQGRDLRAAFSGRSVPSAAVDARTELSGGRAQVNASITAGDYVHVMLEGTVPLAPDADMRLHAGGRADLMLLDPFVAAGGRRLRGVLTFDTDIGGTMAAPHVTGGGKLAGGEIQDYARGVRIHDINATIQADGSRVRVAQLTGRADPGTLSGSGSIDLAAQGMPVDFTLEAKDARPIVSDLITATISGTVKMSGQLARTLNVSGNVQVTRGEINLPERFPPEVAVLNVRRRGQPPPPPQTTSQSRVALNVSVRSTGPIFVRGHGMDAVMGGGIRAGGTATAPQISGGFTMNRGNYSLAGQTLDFTTGRVRFDGTGVRGRLDPTLDFAAQTVSGGVTATLTVTGYASAPKIGLSSSPSLPQDEIIAHLLFQQSVKQLSPLQLASIAQALATIGGAGGGGFSPLSSVRKTLGLDRLAVGSASSGASGNQSQTTVEAGRYVMNNVYVGVKQNLSGGTQTQVQYDITRRLKAQATIATGTNAAAAQGSTLQQDNGSSVGLSYQFEY